MVWRFLAAPQHMNTVAFDQPESVWPVHGSVLFHRGVIYAAAGRSSYLDGGIMLYGLDPVSGRMVVERRIESEHAGAMPPPKDAVKHALKIRQNWLDYKTKMAPDKSDSFAMRGATPDILVADAESIYMRHMRFDRNLMEQDTKRPHLFSTSSLLDDWEHNRSYWVIGTGDFYNIPVAYPWIIGRDIKVPIGLMMAFDEKTVWSVRRGGKNSISATTRPDPTSQANSLPDFQRRSPAKDSGDSGWKATLGIRARAMVQAGDLLFLGGMPADHRGAPSSPWILGGEGEKHGCLRVVSCSNGKTLREMKLASPPVWDGMAAAEGRLFIPCTDGSLVSLASHKPEGLPAIGSEENTLPAVTLRRPAGTRQHERTVAEARSFWEGQACLAVPATDVTYAQGDRTISGMGECDAARESRSQGAEFRYRRNQEGARL